MSTEPSAVDELHCPGCGYNLFGIDSEKCPECGLAIDRTAAGTSQLPWTHRKSIGRFRAFFKTIELAVLRPKKLAEELNRPVSYADANLFRHICVILAWIPATAAPAVEICTDDLPFGIDVRPMSNIDKALACIVTAVALWIYFLTITGFPGYFFSSIRQSILRQNRALALSYYATSAPLSGGVLLTLAVAFNLILHETISERRIEQLPVSLVEFTLFVICLALFAVVATSIFSPVRLLRFTTHCGALRQCLFAQLLPLAWVILFVVIVGGIVLASAYFAIVVAGLRWL